MRLAVIPARGGSKGLLRKNLKSLHGIPLIAWSIYSAQQCKAIDKVVVSTEDDEIASISKKLGCDVLKRPQNLAQDDSATLSVLQDVCNRISCNEVVVLQPTSPVRHINSLERVLLFFEEGNYDCLATGYQTKVLEYAKHQNLRRQDVNGFFYDDGNIYVIKSELLKSGLWAGGNIGQFRLSRWEQFEIDDEVDFSILEKLLQKSIEQGLQKHPFCEKLRKIKLVVTDVDGVLTDSGMYYDKEGDALKKFNTRDGLGFSRLQLAGIQVAIITSENTEMVSERAKKLNVTQVYQGIKDKKSTLIKIAIEMKIDLSEVAYMGDDLGDLQCIESVGFSSCPQDAHPSILNQSHFISTKSGGCGAFRDFSDFILSFRQP